jgi:hypothetical protein
LGHQPTCLTPRVTPLFIYLGQSLSPHIDSICCCWICSQIVTLGWVTTQIEELFLIGVVEPDVFFATICDILHAMVMIVAGGMLTLNELPPVIAFRVQVHEAAAIDGVWNVNTRRVE